MRISSFAAAMLVVSATHTAAIAADVVTSPLPLPTSGWFVKIGPVGLLPQSSAKISVGGVPFVGASAKANNIFTLGFEGGYSFTPNWSVGLASGLPSKLRLKGDGAAAPFGVLGSVIGGPAILSAQYRFTQFGAFQPYVGAGGVLVAVLRNRDAALTNVRVQSALGFAVHGGFDYMFNERWGAFVDIKKLFVGTVAKGDVAPGLPSRAKVTLDPWVVHTGVVYRF